MLVEETQKPFIADPVVRPRRNGRAILFAGVAGACALGAGLGLWARPAMHERLGAAVQPPEAVETPPATARKLEIVVDDRLPPPTAPIEVLRGAPARAAAPWRPPVEPRLPAAPPQGLIRAQAVTSPAPDRPQPLIAPPAIRAVVPAITGAIAGASLAIARAEAPPPARRDVTSPPPVRLAEAAPPPRPPAHADHAKVRLAAQKAAQQKAAAKLALAQIAADKAARATAAREKAAEAKTARIELAKAQTAKAAQIQATRAAHRLELAQAAKAKAAQAKATKAEQIRLAAAEAKGRAEAREEARQDAAADARKQARLAALAHVLARALPHRARPDPEPVEVVKVAHHRGRKGHEPRVEQAALKSHHGREAARPAPHVARMRPEPVAPDPGSGLMKVSTTPRCARSDPGEAMVCADPGLSAAERQLGRAYQGARAAGVPDAQLRSQQQRWLAARSAAAREAPWAVRDVYMARIAELNGQAKDARDEGY